MKHLISERYTFVVLLMVIFLASFQALSQTKNRPASHQKTIMKLSELKLQLKPRAESEAMLFLDRAPASVSSEQSTVHSPSQRARLTHLQLRVLQGTTPGSKAAALSIQEGRDLSSSFKTNPYYIPACSELLRF